VQPTKGAFMATPEKREREREAEVRANVNGCPEVFHRTLHAHPSHFLRSRYEIHAMRSAAIAARIIDRSILVALLDSITRLGINLGAGNDRFFRYRR